MELLVAVPCHIYVRKQEHCCAGAITFWGIATGLAVLLFAFGPGVFLLFAQRVKRLELAASSEFDTYSQPSGIIWFKGFTRRAILWAMGALVVRMGLVLGLIFEEYIDQIAIVCRAGFVHTSIIACIYAVLAFRYKEPKRKWTLLGAVVLAEAAIAQIIVLLR